MSDYTTVEANVLIFGLEETLSGELRQALSSVSETMRTEVLNDERHGLEALANAWQPLTIVFCGPNANTVRNLRARRKDAVIFAVSRLPEVMDWLDVIEAGADDYCAAPFEATQIRWMLDSNLHMQALAA